MRLGWSMLLLVALGATGVAQDPKKGPANAPAPESDGEKKAEAPKEAPAWRMSEREARKLERALAGYLRPPTRKTRQDMLVGLEKLLKRPVDGHSLLEDVETWVDVATRCRLFGGKKLGGKKGAVVEVKVAPGVHGFPGGIGTVKYWLHLPKTYNPRKALYPLIFCLPDSKVWTNGKAYIEEVWTKRSSKVADACVIVVPVPQSKGESWVRSKSYARAMISLRHVSGTFDATAKWGGPAVDSRRMFLDGGDMAAVVGARFPEMFRGVVLRNSDGRAAVGPNLRSVGGLACLPAYCIIDAKKRNQKQFAEKLKSANGKTLIVVSKDDKYLGAADAIGTWMENLPARAQPRDLRYTVHDASFQRHEWINVLDFDAAAKPAASFDAIADRATNEVRIDVTGVTRFELFLNDAVVDLNKKLKIVITEDDASYEFFHDQAARSLGTTLAELVASNQPWRIYPVRFVVDLPKLRAEAARKAAEEAAKEAAKKKAEEATKKKGTGAKAAASK